MDIQEWRQRLRRSVRLLTLTDTQEEPEWLKDHFLVVKELKNYYPAWKEVADSGSESKIVTIDTESYIGDKSPKYLIVGTGELRVWVFHVNRIRSQIQKQRNPSSKSKVSPPSSGLTCSASQSKSFCQQVGVSSSPQATGQPSSSLTETRPGVRDPWRIPERVQEQWKRDRVLIVGSDIEKDLIELKSTMPLVIDTSRAFKRAQALGLLPDVGRIRTTSKSGMAAQAIAVFNGVSNLLKPGRRESHAALFPDLPSGFGHEKERHFKHLYNWGRRVGNEWIRLSVFQKLYMFNDGTVPILFLRTVLDRYWRDVKGSVNEVKALTKLFKIEVIEEGTRPLPRKVRAQDQSVVVSRIRGPNPSQWDRPTTGKLFEIDELLDLQGVEVGVQELEDSCEPELKDPNQGAKPEDRGTKMGRKRSQSETLENRGPEEKRARAEVDRRSCAKILLRLPPHHLDHKEGISEEKLELVLFQQTGFTCRQPHLHQSAPQLKGCWKCGSTDHEAKGCQRLIHAPCPYCHKPGHLLMVCSELHALCSHCRLRGHKTRGSFGCPTFAELRQYRDRFEAFADQGVYTSRRWTSPQAGFFMFPRISCLHPHRLPSYRSLLQLSVPEALAIVWYQDHVGGLADRL